MKVIGVRSTTASTLLGSLAVAVCWSLLASCGGDPSQTHNVKIDVGGVVSYALDPAEGLAGVTVTLTDVDGRISTATTNSSGLWTIENALPGVYTESYSLAGYETMTATFPIPAGGENNVKNVFITRPTVFLSEERMTGAIAPFGEVVESGEVFDGLAGATLVYSTSGNAEIVVTFTRRVVTGSVQLRDHTTFVSIFATPDATRMIWTFSEAQIMNMNAGVTPLYPGLRNDQDPFTWHRIFISANSYTPIHGDLVTTTATGWFNGVP